LSYINSQYDWTTQLLADVILSVHKISSQNNFQVYPNPTNGDVLRIIGEGLKSYSISSALGQVVLKGKFELLDFNTIQIDELTTGVYFLNLQSDKELMTCKIIVK